MNNKIARLSALVLSLSILPIFALSFYQHKSAEYDPYIANQLKPLDVQMNPLSYSDSITNEPNFKKQTEFNNLNIGNTYDTYRGEGVTVAIIDSGCNYQHVDFYDKNGEIILSDLSASFSLNSNYTQVITKVVKNYNNDFSIIDDPVDNGHGTNVAATVAAQINGVGGAGVAPEATLMILKTNYYFGEIEQAIRYAADNGADIINMSIGAYAESFYDGFNDYQEAVDGADTYFVSAINYAYSKGVTLVAAAGNELTNKNSYPAANEHVIGVGALEKNSGITAAYYTNYGTNNVDVVAPGTVYVADVGSSTSYVETQGTSFASPIVAAVAALYKGKYPNASPIQIENAIKEDCVDIGAAGVDEQFGYGRVDISTLMNDVPVTGVTISPKELTLSINQAYQLSAQIEPADATDQEIIFISNDDNIATVTDDGLVTGVSTGTTEIYVLTNDGSFDDYCTVTVNSDPIILNSISLNQTSFNLRKNSTAQIEVVFNPINPYPVPTVTYESIDDSVASVSSSGLISAHSEGSTIITVSAEQNGTVKTAQCTVNVSGQTYGEAIRNYLDIEDGDYLITCTQNYLLPASNFTTGKSTITAFDEANVESIDPSNAWTFTSLGNNKYTISTEINGATYYLNAESTNNGLSSTTSNSTQWTASSGSETFYLRATNGRYLTNYGSTNWRTYNSANTNGSSNIVLYPVGTGSSTPVEPEIINVSDVNLNVHSLVLEIGETSQLNALISPTNATNQNVSFSSTNQNVASVNQNGLVTALTSGSTTITVTTEDGGFTDSCTVVVNESVVYEKSLQLDVTNFKTEYSFGEELDLDNLSAIFTDSNNKQTTLSGNQLTLVSGGTKILGDVQLTFSYDGVYVSTTVHVSNVGSTSGVAVSSQTTTAITGKGWSTNLNTTSTSNYTNNEFNGTTYNLEKARNLNDGILFLNGSTGCIYNTSPLPNITKIVLNYASGGSTTAAHKVYLGAETISSEPSTAYKSFSSSNGGSSAEIIVDGNYSYFRLDVTNSKNLQLSSIEITYGGAASLAFTDQEQADAYVSYFLQKTGEECATWASGGGMSETTWNILKTEFEEMTDGAKDIIANTATDDADILSLQERYQFIINKYHYDNFLVNSDGQTIFSLAKDASFEENQTSIQITSLIVIAGAITLPLLCYLFSKKKKWVNPR